MKKIVVKANSSKGIYNIRELMEYRDLLYVLALRDFKVRYAQTFLGFAWAFIQPVATIIILTIVFGKAIKVDTGIIPYPLFALCGMVSWTYFAYVVNQSGQSIIGAQEMIKKIYFPRLVIPISKALVGFIDFFIAFVLLIAMFFFYGITPSSNLIYLPIYILMTVISALALGIWLSALTIRYRDFQHAVPFMVQFGLYATPVAYPAYVIVDSLPKWAVIVYYLNPMAGVVEGFRWALTGGQAPSTYSLISFTLVVFLFFSGLMYFRRVERIMADIL